MLVTLRVDLTVGRTFLSWATSRNVLTVLVLAIGLQAVCLDVVSYVRLGLILGQLSLVETERDLTARLLLLRRMQACTLRRMLIDLLATDVVRCLAVTLLFLVLKLQSVMRGLLTKLVNTFTVPDLLLM